MTRRRCCLPGRAAGCCQCASPAGPRCGRRRRVHRPDGRGGRRDRGQGDRYPRSPGGRRAGRGNEGTAAADIRRRSGRGLAGHDRCRHPGAAGLAAAPARLRERGLGRLLGTVTVTDWDGHPPHVPVAFAERYAFGSGPHPHVHGANLGIRASAYLAAGGFPPLRTAEDHALLAAATRAGSWSRRPATSRSRPGPTGWRARLTDSATCCSWLTSGVPAATPRPMPYAPDPGQARGFAGWRSMSRAAACRRATRPSQPRESCAGTSGHFAFKAR